jgi:hypothetical protein
MNEWLPTTLVGLERFCVVLSPMKPFPFSPHAHVVPSAFSPKEVTLSDASCIKL